MYTPHPKYGRLTMSDDQLDSIDDCALRLPPDDLIDYLHAPSCEDALANESDDTWILPASIMTGIAYRQAERELAEAWNPTDDTSDILEDLLG